MKRKLPTILILLVMALLGAMRWIDLSYYTNPATGFVPRGTEWVRYVALLLPLVMALLGLRTVGPRGIAVLRMKNPVLAGLFGAAGIGGIGYGAARLVVSIMNTTVFGILLGILFLWFGVWMCLCAVQLFTQGSTAPTKSALPGVLAALPFCALAVYRVMVNPSSLYRVGAVVSAFSALCAMLWFGMLLRSFYIAMPQRRMRWMYFLGVFCFLFSTCLELVQSVHGFLFTGLAGISLAESVVMGLLGAVAGGVSVSVSGQEE